MGDQGQSGQNSALAAVCKHTKKGDALVLWSSTGGLGSALTFFSSGCGLKES